MALRRSVLALLTAGALSTNAWTQSPPARPAAPPSPEHDFSGPGPEVPKPPPPGERREPRPGWGGPGGPGGPKGEGHGPGGWFGDKRSRENLTPEQMKERAMRDLEKLTPEQRNEVWRSVWAVLNLTPEKRQELIGMEDERRQKVKEEIDRMLQSTGIEVPDDQRRKFFHRYFSGRRAIEEQLKKEGEERRHALMSELEGKLKQEFGTIKADTAQPNPEPPK